VVPELGQRQFVVRTELNTREQIDQTRLALQYDREEALTRA